MNFLQYLEETNRPEVYNEPTPVNVEIETAPEVTQQPMPDYSTLLKKGGKVRKRFTRKLTDVMNSAEALRQKGRKGDTILAHINPIEADILKAYGGSGTINPNTGLPEFSFWTKPSKATKAAFKSPKKFIAEAAGTLGPIVGAMTGNPFIGGAAGKSLRAVMLGQDVLPAALEGGMQGMGVSALGSGLGWLGNATGSSTIGSLGSTLSGQGALGAYNLESIGPWASGSGQARTGVSAGDNYLGDTSKLTRDQLANMTNDELAYTANRKSYLDALTPKSFTEKTTDFLMKPETMLSLGTLGLSAYNSNQTTKEQKKSAAKQEAYDQPEAQADRKKRYSKAMTLTPEEIEANNKYLQLLAGENTRPIDLMPIRPLYRRKRTQEEYDRDGNWFDYYENPEMIGEPVRRRKGGPIEETSMKKELRSVITPEGQISMEKFNDGPTIFSLFNSLEKCQQEGESLQDVNSINFNPIMDLCNNKSPLHCANSDRQDISSDNESHYLEGNTGGQDDKIPALLSDGEYVIDASTVSDLGDGNSKAGAQKLDSMVQKIRKHKRGGKKQLPPKSKSILDYIKI